MRSINQISQIKKSLLVVVFLLVIFILSIGVWYSPALFKGYPAYTMTPNIPLARNLQQTGLYSVENDLNVFLSSSLLEEQGHLSAYGNKLTSLIYAQIFKITGLLDENNLLLFSIIIHALTLLIFTLIVLYLFGFKIGVVFSLVYIFLPINWYLPYHLGVYEIALFFLACFFLLFFYGRKRKYDYLYLGFSGIFLALVCLAKEALLLIIPFLFVFLWLVKEKRYLIYIFIPWLILIGIFWLPDFSHNVYLKLFSTQASEEVKSADFASYGHLYPDPYTYHFEQEKFLDNLQQQIDGRSLDLISRLETKKTLANQGIKSIGLVDRATLGLVLFFKHIFRFASLEDLGGPFVLLLMFLGTYGLRKKNKYLYRFFVYWIFSAIFLLSFLILAARSHLMDFNWAIALLISLGLLTLIKVLVDYFKISGRGVLIVSIIIISVGLYNFIIANHILWGRIYDDSSNLIAGVYSQEIEKANISEEEVIATALAPGYIYSLNYLTNKSIVIFHPETIKNLLDKNELSSVFQKFKVKYILGYSEEITEKIINQTEVKNIVSSSFKVDIHQISRNKGWLMNLIK
jgi:hypothetical protein